MRIGAELALQGEDDPGAEEPAERRGVGGVRPCANHVEEVEAAGQPREPDRRPRRDGREAPAATRRVLGQDERKARDGNAVERLPRRRPGGPEVRHDLGVVPARRQVQRKLARHLLDAPDVRVVRAWKEKNASPLRRHGRPRDG